MSSLRTKNERRRREREGSVRVSRPSPSLRPAPSDELVGAHCVGPIPPVVTTQSYLPTILRAASTISSSSSAMTSIRLRSMPRSKQCLAKKLELVSRVLPLRTSSPMTARDGCMREGTEEEGRRGTEEGRVSSRFSVWCLPRVLFSVRAGEGEQDGRGRTHQSFQRS